MVLGLAAEVLPPKATAPESTKQVPCRRRAWWEEMETRHKRAVRSVEHSTPAHAVHAMRNACVLR